MFPFLFDSSQPEELLGRRDVQSSAVDSGKPSSGPATESDTPKDSSSSSNNNNKESAGNAKETNTSQSSKPTADPIFGNSPSQSLTVFNPPATTTSPTSTSPSSSSSSSSSVTPTSSSSSSSSSRSTISSSSSTTSATMPVFTISPTSSASATHSLPSAVQDTDSSSSSPDTLSGGAIGAIVAIVCIVLLGVGAFMLVKRRKKRMEDNKRLTRFSMGPTYNATTSALQQDNAYGYYNNNNMGMTAAEPYGYQNMTTYNPMSQPISNAFMSPPPPGPQQPVVQANNVPPPVQQQQPPIAQEQQQQGTQQDFWQQQPIGTYTVVAAYTPTLNDEIDVQPGDQVHIYVEYDDGWCLGANLTRGGERGVFPKHCVMPPSLELQQQMPVAQQQPSETLMAKHQSKRISSLYNNNAYQPPQL